MKVSIASLLVLTTVVSVQLASPTLLSIGIMLPALILVFGTPCVSMYLRYSKQATESSRKSAMDWYCLALGWTMFNAIVFIILDECFDIFSNLPK